MIEGFTILRFGQPKIDEWFLGFFGPELCTKDHKFLYPVIVMIKTPNKKDL